MAVSLKIVFSQMALSGLFILLLPPSMVTPGDSLEVTVQKMSGNGGWFMVHGYGNAINEATESLVPEPKVRAIAAFMPHEEGAFGLTIEEYEIDLRALTNDKSE